MTATILTPAAAGRSPADTPDGAAVTVTVRPLDPGERDLVERFYAALSPGSRYLRFLQAVGPALPEPLLRQLLDSDGVGRVTLGAFVGEECAGIASYAVLDSQPDAAEVSVAVAEAHRRRGVARLLVDALAQRAAAHGIGALVCLVQPGNRAALRLLRSLGVVPVLAGGLLEGRRLLLPPA